MIEVGESTATCSPNVYRLRSTAESAVRGNFEWTVHWPENLITDALALDLLEIAKSVHMADRMFRRSFRLGQRARSILVRVAVRNPTVWKRERRLLERLAGFATADNWRLDFCRSRAKRSRPRATRRSSIFSVVALFSGGLDSLCGAAYLAQKGEVPLFVSHSPPGRDHNRSLIRGVWKQFRKEDISAGQCVSFRLELRERDQGGHRRMFQEPSRRSRPFFFLALACAVAIEQGIPCVQMSENGALGLSLPIRADAYGAMCSRQAHEFLLRGFSELLNSVAPSAGAWRVYNPFVRMTKGDACDLLRGAAYLAKDAISCEYVGRQAAYARFWKRKHPRAGAKMGEGPQCGICVPCLIRRAALAKAGVPDSNREYFFDARRVRDWDERRPRPYLGLGSRIHLPIYRVAAEHVFHMRRFCEELLKLDCAGFAIKYMPELRFSLVRDRDSGRQLTENYVLMRKLAREMLEFLDAKR
jgi:hypothetical protein